MGLVALIVHDVRPVEAVEEVVCWAGGGGPPIADSRTGRGAHLELRGRACPDPGRELLGPG